MSRIVLHIDRLVLRGLSAEQAKAFRKALVEDLSRRLARPGMAASLRGQPGRRKVRTDPVAVASEEPADLASAVGRRLAGVAPFKQGGNES
jgi:hypothetical protein